MIKPPNKIGDTNVAYSSFLGPGFVAWHGYDEKGEKLELSVQQVLPNDLGPRTILGEVGLRHQGDETWITCQAPGITALTLRSSGGTRWVAIQSGDKWSVPVESSASGVMSCHGSDVVFTFASKETVDQTICRLGSCQSTFAKVPTAKKRIAAALGSKVATLGATRENGGVWLRIANIADLERTPGTLVFDDLVAESKRVEMPWLLETRLIAMGDSALLFVTTKEATYLMRVAADGKLEPLDVRFE
jgi:hypothetical protein